MGKGCLKAFRFGAVFIPEPLKLSTCFFQLTFNTRQLHPHHLV